MLTHGRALNAQVVAKRALKLEESYSFRFEIVAKGRLPIKSRQPKLVSQFFWYPHAEPFPTNSAVFYSSFVDSDEREKDIVYPKAFSGRLLRTPSR